MKTKKQRRIRRATEKRIMGIQRHHITYKPEWIVPIYKGEHFILTMIQRRAYVSLGFIQSIDFELKRIRPLATDLNKIDEARRQDLLAQRKRLSRNRKRKAKAKRNPKISSSRGARKSTTRSH